MSFLGDNHYFLKTDLFTLILTKDSKHHFVTEVFLILQGSENMEENEFPMTI
jgi:hypothetical protein